jgi:hypothetical protein
MFVGQQHAVQGSRLDAHLAKAQAQLFAAQAGIDHQPQAAAFDDRRIPATATAKHHKSHHGADDGRPGPKGK